ncbi:MAG: tetratricopeptide repeat protein [Candidatus Zixiibacteriota bacterium]|nr:MAG: tetratricopeptide repeat protein [candidate division Zixibacteria bacterium]
MAVVAMHGLGCILPASVAWGFNYWSLIDTRVALAGLVLALVMALWPVFGRKPAAEAPPAAAQPRRWPRPARAGLVVTVSALMVAALFLLRSRALVYGDGYAVLDHAAGAGDATVYDQYFLQILAAYFHRGAYLFLNGLFSLSSEHAYALVNSIGGMLGLWAIYRLAGQIATCLSSRLFIAVGAMTSASVILFFGYIENYTWATALGLWTLSYSIAYVRGKGGAVGLVVLGSLCVFYHLIALPFAVTALLAIFIKSDPRGTSVFGVPIKTIGVFLIVLSAALALASHLLEITALVPLWPIRDNPYSVLSQAHLIDIANEIMLVAPVGLALLILTLVYRRGRAVAVGEDDSILGMAALLTFLTAFWIDPEIGAVRDWDLLSFFGLPLTMWALLRFSKYFRGRCVPGIWMLPVLAVVFVNIGPNLCEKNRPDLAVSRLDALLCHDPHYGTDYRMAERCIPWAVILHRGVGDKQLPMKYYYRRLDAFPGSYRACFNLADSYFHTGFFDSAYIYLRRGIVMKADEPEMLVNLSKTALELGLADESLEWAQKAVELDPERVPALSQLAIAFANCGRRLEAVQYFQQAFRRQPDEYRNIFNLATGFAMMGASDSAYQYYAMALPVAPHDRKSRICCCLISLCLELGRLNEAGAYLATLRQINPASPDIPVFTAQLAAASKSQ